MVNQKYLFQRKKLSFTKRLFEKGLNTATLVLFSLKEQGKLLLGEMPSSYPAFKILKDIFGVNPGKKRFTRDEVFINLRRLEKQGLVRKEPKRKIYLLTDEGRELLTYIEDRYSILSASWDKKLRIVIFDIPEKQKFHREWLRKELILLGFKELQKSVYVGKYPLPKSFYQDIARFGLFQYVFIFTIDKVDKEKQVLKLLED